MSAGRPLAVVTGASSGIGLELARQFATNGFDLIVAAEDDAILATAIELSGDDCAVEALQVDLAADGGVDALVALIAAAARPVAAVALNAGITEGGAFVGGTSLERELRLIDLNVRSTTHLAKHVVADMVARGEGRILFTSSISATMPGPFAAVYNASKSFVQSFALGLRSELKDTGVSVTLLMPGPTDTEIFARGGMLETKIGAGHKDDPADVARDGFEALMAGKERVVSHSLLAKVQGRGSRLLPDSAKAALHRRMAQPGSAGPLAGRPWNPRPMLQPHAAEGIHRIEHAYVNWYLVEDGGRITVVDSGHPASWGALHSALADLGRSAGDIDAIVLTHAHFDHVGFAERARVELGVPVYAHERELPLARHPWRYDHERSRLEYAVRHPSFVRVLAAMGAAGALWVKGSEFVRPFAHGQVLDVPGRPAVVFTPGHTYGHCALHFADRGAVIAGDALVTFNPYTGGHGPQIVAGAATADSAQALASLDGLVATGADTVLTGHGPVWRDGALRAAEHAYEIGPT